VKISQAIADRLFERMGLDVGLTGDLLEERARGRSALWYWIQVAMAILAGIRSVVRNHKADVFRVVAMGFALVYLTTVLWNLYGFRVPELSIEQWVIQSFGVLAIGIFIGWLIADREHPLPTVMVFAIIVSIWFLGHDLFWVRLLIASVDRPMFRPDVAMFFLTFFSQYVGLVIGGALVRPRKRT
jgi:hypothetical protein